MQFVLLLNDAGVRWKRLDIHRESKFRLEDSSKAARGNGAEERKSDYFDIPNLQRPVKSHRDAAAK
jgi:hypothetical protein